VRSLSGPFGTPSRRAPPADRRTGNQIPRKADGSVDVEATAQKLNDKVESWVREYPGQWQWFHDRWNIKNSLK
jgi:lauroyl/myristoyl acyltransferase